MKNSPWIYLVVILVVIVLKGPASANTFSNGDFEPGNFSGWAASIDDGSSAQTVDPDIDAHFSILPNSGPANSYTAQISLDDTYWSNTLYQDFSLDALNRGYGMEVTLWVKWSPTASDVDGISVVLSNTGYSDTVDLLSGISTGDLLNGVVVTQDITPFAQNWGGMDVEIAFNIFDLDFRTTDTLLVDNVEFTQYPASPVPIPGSMLLLSSGVLAVLFSRKRDTRHAS